MSRRAIAAVLARGDLVGGERLVAFSLASFAGREDRAWPGASAAAVRAGLSRSRYLCDRDRLVRRGLVDVEQAGSGRGRASTVVLRFAAEGPWWDGEINPVMFEGVLSHTRMRGPARLLVAALAALAGGDGVVRGVSNEELCAAAGLEDRTYRRARPQLVASGELVLLSGARGRGNTNVWQVQTAAPNGEAGQSTSVWRRVAVPRGQRPLLAIASTGAVAEHGDRAGIPARGSDRRSAEPVGDSHRASTDVRGAKGGQDRTVSVEKCPVRSGVLPVKDGQHRTLFEIAGPENPAQTPAENPAENPAPIARTGKEPQNPRTPEPGIPPNPPRGGATPVR